MADLRNWQNGTARQSASTHANVQSELAEISNNLTQLKRELDAARAYNSSLNRERDELDNKIANLNAQRNNVDEKISDSQQTIDKLTKIIADAQAAHEKLIDSAHALKLMVQKGCQDAASSRTERQK